MIKMYLRGVWRRWKLKGNNKQAWENWYNHRLEKGETRGEIFLKRRDFYLQFLSSIENPPHLRILDIGCGKGETIYEIESSDDLNYNSYEFYGVDITKEILYLAKKKISKANFICADVFRLPFEDGSIDITMCVDLLHHLTGNSRSKSKSNVQKAIKEIVRVTNDSGFIIIMEECVKWRASSYLVFLAIQFCSLLHIDFLYLGIQKGIPVSFLTPKELYEILKNSGVEVIAQDQDDKKKTHVTLSLLLRDTWVKCIGRVH